MFATDGRPPVASSKLEIRSSKQIRMPEEDKFETEPNIFPRYQICRFEPSDLLRISIFGIRIWHTGHLTSRVLSSRHNEAIQP